MLMPHTHSACLPHAASVHVQILGTAPVDGFVLEVVLEVDSERVTLCALR
jgi:hypothetical protein